MIELNEKNSGILQKIFLPNKLNVEIYLKREDLIHPHISGNKWHKLKFNLIEAQKLNKKTLLTFGGAYSNHIYAVASAGKQFGFKTIGIIRGEEHLPLNPTLEFSVQQGMHLHYIDRTNYRKRNNKEFQAELAENFGDVHVIPEGGTNMLALKGASEITNNIDIEFDYICCAVGTGGTISGIISSQKGNRKVLGFSVLKNGSFLKTEVRNLVYEYTGENYSNWDINLDYHLGGYAKINYEFVQFVNQFKENIKIDLDYIYTGKMMYGIIDLINKNFFDTNAKIIAVHTGGIQGNIGMQTKINKLEK